MNCISTFLIALGFFYGTSALAQTQPERPEASALRVTFKCDPELAAKILVGETLISIANSTNANHDTATLEYMNNLTQIKTCDEAVKFYDGLRPVALQGGINLDQYYATEEGKTSLRDAASTLKDLIKSSGPN